MAGRLLVIRGGAIGDFILTLPALKLLREGFPECHIEIVGYRHICTLAERRYYANATRSIEYAPLAGFFNPRAELDKELVEYFAGFNQVISYIYDPDALFAGCLKRAGVRNLIAASPKVTDAQHAAYQLAQPLEQMALYLDDPAAHFYPSDEDKREASRLLAGHPAPFVSLHPGSGAEQKNWPLKYWQQLIAQLADDTRVGTLVLISGDADRERLAELSLPKDKLLRLESLPLCTLGAVLARCAIHVGHDTGISHLAAASGARCVLLFGPTDPQIWAPKNTGVHLVQAQEGDLSRLEVRDVVARVDDLLGDV